MHFTSFLSLASLALPLASAACNGGTASGHRRHHAKLTASSGTVVSRTAAAASSSAQATASGQANLAKQGAGSASASVAWSSTASSSSSAAAASSSASASSNSSSSSGSSWGLSGLTKNGIYIGFLPDDGSGEGGSTETLAQINSALGVTSAHSGWYAQAQSGSTFDGSQFTYREASIMGASVFIATVMPTGGWSGLTNSDNSQAQNIANVMKTWSDKGVEVWLRFGHEMNYYQTDGTYTGDASDFLEGWDVVYAAVKATAPKVKMFWSPNVASAAQYAEYYPGADKVDIVGIDYYPTSVSSTSFLDTMQDFHDTYTNENTIFAIGETGLGMSASMADRLAWMQQITSTEVAAAMPRYLGLAWFNYQKGYNFRVADTDGDSVTKSYFASS